jgi:hypothetical protein
LRTNWLCLSLVVLAGAFVITVTAMFERSVFVRGFFVGSGATGLLAAIGFLVVQFTGTANAMAGELAERWTAEELRKLRRDGWYLINHFRLGRTEIDHVLVGPGGVFAVETKWSSEAWDIDPLTDRLQNAIDYVCGEARSLALWVELKRAGIESVEPVVFLWGQAAAGLSERAAFDRLGGAVVVAGQEAKEFRARLATGVLTPDQVKVARQAIERQLSQRDERDPEPSIPPSVLRVLGVAIVTFAAALGTFYVSLRLLPVLGSILAWPADFGALALVPLLVRRKRFLRYPVLAWWAGLAAAAVLAATAVVVGV